VSTQLRLQESFASVKYLPGILEKGVPILMFAGAEDLICNYKGIERMIENLEWAGVKGFGVSATRPLGPIARRSLAERHSGRVVSERHAGGRVDIGTEHELRQSGSYARMQFSAHGQVFDSSHMVGFDVPHVTNDMITRFMGVDLALLPGVLGSTAGKLGGVNKVALSTEAGQPAGLPLFKGGKSDVESELQRDEKQDGHGLTAEYYNAGSAFLILVILGSIVGLYFYFRRRRSPRRRVGLPTTREDPLERVPLGSERVELTDLERAEEYELDDEGRKRRRDKGKGKERARESQDHAGQTVFALGDDDDR